MENGSPGGERSRAAFLRDAALARVRLTRRWVIAGAAVLTAGFAALVSAVAPGRSLSSKHPAADEAARTASAASSSSGSAIPRMPAPANAADLGLQAPGQAPSADQPQPSQPQPQPAPQPAPAPPPSGGVVSGGS